MPLLCCQKTQPPARLVIFHSPTCVSSHSNPGMCYPFQTHTARSCVQGLLGSPKDSAGFISLETRGVGGNWSRGPSKQLLPLGQPPGPTLRNHCRCSCIWLTPGQQGHPNNTADSQVQRKHLLIETWHKAWSKSYRPPHLTPSVFTRLSWRQNE